MHNVIKEIDDKPKRDGTFTKKKVVNWDFWNERIEKNFDLYLDEVHQLAHARSSMSKDSIILSRWIAQIRKIIGSNERLHIFLITQRTGRLDIAWRDLVHTYIVCRKIQMNKKIQTKVYRNGKYSYKMLPMVYVENFVFMGHSAQSRAVAFCDYLTPKNKLYDRRIRFLANPFYHYYDSYNLVRFGEDSYL